MTTILGSTKAPGLATGGGRCVYQSLQELAMTGFENILFLGLYQGAKQ